MAQQLVYQFFYNNLYAIMRKSSKQKPMNKLGKLLMVLPVSLLVCTIARAQAVTGVNDSLAIKSQNEKQTEAQVQVQKKTQTQTRTGENANSEVKQVLSARPDMSKAKGARPPSIVRPSGSRIPKGVGRPGGAGGPGRR